MYLCQTLDPNNPKLCLAWVEQSNFISELSQLTYADTNVILGYTAALFALAWVWKRVSLFASR